MMAEERQASRSASESDDDPVRLVGYLVGLNTATSIPVEVSRQLPSAGFDIDLIVYYRNDVRDTGVPPEQAIELRGRGAWDVRAIFRLMRYLRARRPDVLHVHHSWSAFVGVALSRLLGVGATVKTEHRAHASKPTLKGLLNALTLLLVDRVVTNSDATAASFSPWLQKRLSSRTRTIHNGIDLERIAAASPGPRRRKEVRRTMPGGRLKLLSVGRLIEEKNQSTLIRALATGQLSKSKFGLTLVGGGPMQEKLERLSERCGVSDRVRLTGWIPRETVYELLHAGDLFVIPSLSEGFCNAVVEAMAAGCPVICSDIPALREVVGPAGVFVDPFEPAEFARAMADLADSGRDDRAARGAELRERARSRFGIDRAADAYRKLYTELSSC